MSSYEDRIRQLRENISGWEFDKDRIDALVRDGEMLPLPADNKKAKLDQQIAEAEAKIVQLNAEQHANAGPLQPGTVIDGKYRLEAELGAGGNGAVWRIHDLNLDRVAAMKVLHSKYSNNEERVERFRREMKTVANLDHDHIIRVYDTGAYNGQLYVVMQYVDGNALSRRTKGTATDLDTVIGWLSQVASALDFAHSTGIVHRDVKPDNILRRESDGRLFLADFGLVFSHGDEADLRLTATNTSVGTTYYMAPEQVDASHGDITPATDIYALGIVAYELLTGTVPFTGSKQNIKEAHRYERVPENPHLTDAVLKALRTATAKQPALRYAAATDFVAALEAASKGQAPPDRVEQYIIAWAERMNEPIDDAFDIPTLLSADTTTLAPEAEPGQPKPPSGRRRHMDKLQKKKQRQAQIEQKGDYQQHDQHQAEPVPNVRERLLTFEQGVLLGQPGSGKSWTLRRLMFDYLRRWREQPDAARIPVFVPLNQYRGHVAFADFVREQMGDFAAYYEPLLRGERLTLLCDALNEMPDQKKTLPEVKQYLAEVREAAHFIVSCRVLDYQRQLDDLRPLEMVTLRPLDLPDIHRFIITYWGEADGANLWAAMGGSDDLFAFHRETDAQRFWDGKAAARSRRSSEEPWRRMHAGAGLIPLCRSPFMAGLVCALYDPDESLPASRGAIFQDFVEQALSEESERARELGNPFPAVDDVETTLAGLADAMQARKVTVLGRTGDDAPPVMAQADQIDAGIAASILTGDKEQVRFAHQLFQEYFAARVLLAAMERGDDPTDHISGNWWEPGVWRETAVILGEVADPNEVAAWLAPYSPELARIVVFENAEVQAGQKSLSESARTAIVQGAWERSKTTSPIERAAAYRVLGHPDIDADDREGVGLRPDGLPDIVWRPVEAGTYTVGGDSEARNPLDKQTYTVAEGVQIALYPVTYQQFEAFRQSPAFENTEHPCWADMPENQRGPKAIDEQRYKYGNHPRESVSWYGAAAFCRWLTEQYRDAGIIGENEAVVLPDERLWEAAARGKDSNFYPFGGDQHDANKANVAGTGIGMTSAVGIFPAGAADCGALDMSGNVWEWTASKFNDPNDTSVDGSNSRRVLRGASFNNDATVVLRAAARVDSLPNNHSFVRGFRVVLVPI